MAEWLKFLLNPESVTFAQGELWLVAATCLPLTLAGLYAIWKSAKRLGTSGGAITVESFLFGVPLALIALMFADLVLYLAFRSAYVENRSQFSLVYGILQLVIGIACVAVLRQHRWEPAGSPPRIWARVEPAALGKTIAIWVLAVPVIILSMAASVALARLGGIPVEQQKVLSDLTESPDAMKIFGAYTMAVLAVPLAEEFAFRVVLFGGLRGLLAGNAESGPGVVLAYAISIGLFVFAHGVWSLEQVYLALPLTTLSIALTLVYAHSKSIWPCVLFHALHNGLVLTLQFFLL